MMQNLANCCICYAQIEDLQNSMACVNKHPEKTCAHCYFHIERCPICRQKIEFTPRIVRYKIKFLMRSARDYAFKHYKIFKVHEKFSNFDTLKKLYKQTYLRLSRMRQRSVKYLLKQLNAILEQQLVIQEDIKTLALIKQCILELEGHQTYSSSNFCQILNQFTRLTPIKIPIRLLS